MKKLLIDPFQKIFSHLDFLFGPEISTVLPPNLDIEYSKKTGKIKNFSVYGKLIGTFRTDGGIALTIYGANILIKHEHFLSNCIIPIKDAIPFVSEGRSLFVKHVLKCGSNVKNGSDVAIIDDKKNVLAVGRSLQSYSFYNQNSTDKFNALYNLRGVGVKVREGIKSRTSQ